jgi:uncharacterized membrane protein
MEEKLEENKPKDGEKEEENVALAVIAYLPFLFFVPLLTESKDDPFVKFHVKQSLLIFCAYIAISALGYFPILRRFMWVITDWVYLAWFVFIGIGISNAVKNKKKELPLIGKYSEKFFKF